MEQNNGVDLLSNLPLAVVIAVWQVKGGSGKTTVAVNTASALAATGKKVLFLDLDPNTNATDYLGVNADVTPSLLDVFTHNTPMSILIQTEPHNFDVIPSHDVFMDAIEEALEDGDEAILKTALESLKHDYDYIIIDNAPGRSTSLKDQGLTAADHVLIPLTCTAPNMSGLEKTMMYLRKTTWVRHNPDLKILGLFPNYVRRVGEHSLAVLKQAKEYWGDKVLPFEVSDTELFSVAFNQQIPAVALEPNHKQVQPYFELAQYINEKTKHQ